MFAIEEKRMELDECMMEMEERRWQQQQEREERYRREQQDRDANDVWTAIICFSFIIQCVL